MLATHTLLADEDPQWPLPGVVPAGGRGHGIRGRSAGRELAGASGSAVSVRAGVGSDDAAASLALRGVITGKLPSADPGLRPAGPDGDHR
jgi:hypothetical protein